MTDDMITKLTSFVYAALLLVFTTQIIQWFGPVFAGR